MCVNIAPPPPRITALESTDLEPRDSLEESANNSRLYTNHSMWLKVLFPLGRFPSPLLHALPTYRLFPTCIRQRTRSQDVGVNSESLSESFGEEYPLLVDVINSLLMDVRMYTLVILTLPPLPSLSPIMLTICSKQSINADCRFCPFVVPKNPITLAPLFEYYLN